ncbi:MAG: methyl-accepting chemotaxis protein [Myxococcales bacterium]|nr:methyl-accepting chemotaxis protein [Myxococcales bacterium]
MNASPDRPTDARAVPEVRLSLASKIALINLATVLVTLAGVLVLTQSEFYRSSSSAGWLVFAVLTPILAVSWMASRWLIGSLQALTVTSQAMGRGDLRAPPVRSRKPWPDELDVIAHASAALVEDLRELVQRIRGSAQAVERSAEQLVGTASAVGTQAEGVREQLGRITERTEQQTGQAEAQRQHIERMAEDLRRAAALADEAARSTRDTREAAGAGSETTRQVIGRLHSVFERVDDASVAVVSLSARTAEIHEIVEAISAVAQQTHLLSVNASIEAARAGEAGQGFAVVAEEIRRLADASGQSAARIRELVQRIEGETRSVVETMRASSSELGEGRARLDEILATLDEIAQAARREADKVEALTALTREQLELTQDVVQITQSVRQGTDRIAEASRQAEQASAQQRQHTVALGEQAEQLRALATGLTDAAGHFQR